MRIIQTVFGVFHHFELAHELEQRNHLQAIYSTWPWARLKREGLPHQFVKSFPWIHTGQILLGRSGFSSIRFHHQLAYMNALSFDRWTASEVCKNPAPDAIIAISGSGLKTGRALQREGAVFICDRGSTHHRYQERIVAGEYKRWGVELPVSDIRMTIREEATYEVANAISVPSSFAARSFLEMGVEKSKINVLPYGVRLDNFRASQDPPPIRERFEILFAGQISLRKGVPYLLMAFQQVRHPNKRLRMVGTVTPDMKPVLKRLPLEGVEFLGSMPQPELAHVMSSSHLLVLPSIEEGLALVQGQAMACGCPVLATTNTGAEDLFSDNVEGFIVPIRDVTELADRMQRIAEDPDLQARMRFAALERVRFLGGWKDYGDRWEALLRRLTSRIDGC
jgi:starch synthase